MSQQPVPANELGGVIGRIHQLGMATEALFSRLYRGLHRRAEFEQQRAAQQTALAIQTAQTETLKRRLREKEGENTIDEGIIMQDMEGRIVLINKAAKDLLGSGKAFWESELATLFDAYRDVTYTESEITPLGEPTRIQINNRILGAQLAAVSDDGRRRLGTMIVLRDVTRDALAERLKNQFVLGISHELNTPMQVIKGSSELIANTPEGKAVNKRYLELLTRNVDILNRMVTELLDLSEMGAGNFTLRSDALNVEDLVWSVVNGMTPEIRKMKHDVSVMVRDADQLTITGDAERLRWALGHLVQNAARYSEAGSHLTVTVSSATTVHDQKRHVVVQVIDNGVGISDKDLPHVFERFYRGEPRTAAGKLLDPRGLGQGLFIARTVTEAHGGYITVQTQPGGGSVFTMVLPQ
jgi:two-component system, OmpR family, sensor histidine kinase ResE